MRKIGIRQFQQNFHKELKQLPFIVTKDGQDFCIVAGIKYPDKQIKSEVTAYKSPSNNLTGLKPLPEDGTNLAISPTGKCEIKTMNCKLIGKGYNVTYSNEEGEVIEKRFLCDSHAKASRSPHVKVEPIS